jgi:hypothetical protein
MLGFPVGGLIIYTLFGRGWKAFSRKNQLHTLIEGTSLVERKAVMVERQPVLLDELSRTNVGEYARLGHMLWLAADAPLTLTSRLEILQDAREEYPCLMADVRTAAHSIRASRSRCRSVRSSSAKLSSFELNRPSGSVRSMANGERRGAQFLRNDRCCCLHTTLGAPCSLMRIGGRCEYLLEPFMIVAPEQLHPGDDMFDPVHLVR